MKKKIVNLLRDSFPYQPLRSGLPLNDLVIEPTAAINESLMVETESVREKMSLANYSLMTTDELDLLASNYLAFERQVANKARGALRIYLTQRTDLVFSKDRNYFKSKNNLYFRPVYDFAISNVELKYDENIKLYYIDILIESIISLNADTVIPAGDVVYYLGDNPFVQRIENLSSLIVNKSLESNFEVYSRLVEHGVLTNPTRKNYIGATLLNTFPDIKRIILAGANHPLMERDLTFNYLNASGKIQEFNFFKKKSLSTVNNSNFIFAGLLQTIDPNDFSAIPSLESMREFTQSEYDAVAFKDGDAAEISTLLSQVYFPAMFGYSALLDEGIFLSETGAKWDTGSSAVTFTGDVNTGLEVKGNYVDNPTLIQNEKGVVFYKQIDDPRNKEFSLQFVIKDFTYTPTTSKSVVATNVENISKTSVQTTTDLANNVKSVTISNNQPLYFTVLKKGQNDTDLDIISSSYDGYGVVIMKKFVDQRPNVFIIDGSTGVGEIAFEEEILKYGSERVIAGKYIPLEADINYHCIMQINDAYGMNVIFRDEFNSEVGTISVGSGGIQGTYETIYDSEENKEIKLKSDSVSVSVVPRKFPFITSSDLDLQCSGVLNLKFTIAKSTSNLLTYAPGSLRIVRLQNAGDSFSNFANVATGDILDISNQKYVIKRKITNTSLELGSNVILAPAGSAWKIWKDLAFSEDFIIPQKPYYNNLTLLYTGVKKIKDFVTSNINNVELNFNYIQRNGVVTSKTLNWLAAGAENYVAYNATDEQNVKLKDVYIFDKTNGVDASLVENEDYFFCVENFTKFNYVYFTQEGFNKITSRYMRFEVAQNTSERQYLINKSDFKKGYQIPINYKSGINNITFLHKCYSAETEFQKNTQYLVSDNEISDILVLPESFSSFFEKNISFDCEVIGTGAYANIDDAVVSSLGDNKIYTDTVLTSDYYTVIIKGHRYYIQSIVELTSGNLIFSGKQYEITLDKVVDILDNEVADFRKIYNTSINSSKARFGFRYDLKFTKTNADPIWIWDTSITTVNIAYGSRDLILGEDFEYDRKIPVVNFYLPNSVYSILSSSNKIIFNCEKRVITKENIRNKEYEFYPISKGSYLGIGFKNVNNGVWNLLELKIRQLLERYSAFYIKLNVGANVKNEDRLFLDMNSFALNLNAIETKNGVNIHFYNKLTNTWEFIYQNNAISSSEGDRYLQFYDGQDVDVNKYNFGYWSGSNFISLNNSFYPVNYVDNDGYFNILITTRGKTDNNYSADIISSEARLYLNYINLIWQKDIGIHTGNKMDIWVASDSNSALDTKLMRLNNSTNEIELDDTFLRPILNIISIKNSLDIEQPFTMYNINKNLRFSSKERLKLVFNSELPAGDYYVTYEYLPNILGKQDYVDSLNRETDILIKSMVPVFVKLNLSYAGTIDEAIVKNTLEKYVKFSNNISFDQIVKILQDNGAAYVTFSNIAPIIVEEYDTLQDKILLEFYNTYSLKQEKYFDIKVSDITLNKL